MPHNTEKGTRVDLVDLLRASGVKVTQGRLELLRLLQVQKKPVDAQFLSKKLEGVLDAVSVYRALESFIKIGIVRKVDFQNGRAMFEFQGDHENHHHHAVCKKCELVEDVSLDEAELQRKVLRRSKHFTTLEEHTIEFFGICKSCSVS